VDEAIQSDATSQSDEGARGSLRFRNDTAETVPPNLTWPAMTAQMVRGDYISLRGFRRMLFALGTVAFVFVWLIQVYLGEVTKAGVWSNCIQGLVPVLWCWTIALLLWGLEWLSENSWEIRTWISDVFKPPKRPRQQKHQKSK
jgi:hypothetical protein